MPVSQLEPRAHIPLPDIFQTLNGTSFDIGMFDHLRDAGNQSAPWGRGAGHQPNPSEKTSFPRIVLRDALGHELDTFTTLQEAIYRAKWNIKRTGLAKEPLEWRLPKAPPPARPDLTRTFPPVKHPPIVHPDGRVKTKWDHSRVLEFDVEDVGFVRESLQYLPFAPSLSFLRQEILVGPKTYFQIVGTMLLHNRILSQTEKRKAIYNFPGFCSGCIRMGICYGCERSSEVHFHEDKPVKTGGGFTYFKKDRPEREMQSKNPINWKVRHPNRTLKKLMEDYSGVDLEGEIPAEIKRHLDEHGGHREKIVTLDSNEGEGDEDKLGNNRKRKANIQVNYNIEGAIEDEEGDFEENQGRRKHDIDLNDVRVEMGYDGGDSDIDSELDDPNATDMAEGHDKDGHGRRRRRKNRNTDRSKSENGIPSPSRRYGGDRDTSDDRQIDRNYQGTSDDEHMDQGNHTDNSSQYGRRSRRTEKLYKPPPAFKLRKSPKRSIQSKSPFSTNRSYDLPKGNGLDIKKSEKKLTQFKDFRKGDAEWKEPKKFELKKTEQQSTKFWSGPSRKKEEKKTTGRRGGTSDRSRGLRRVPSPRSVSPDSGLESELLTAKEKNAINNRARAGEKDLLYDVLMTDEKVLEKGEYELSNPTLEPLNQRTVGKAHSQCMDKKLEITPDNPITKEADGKYSSQPHHLDNYTRGSLETGSDLLSYRKAVTPDYPDCLKLDLSGLSLKGSNYINETASDREALEKQLSGSSMIGEIENNRKVDKHHSLSNRIEKHFSRSTEKSGQSVYNRNAENTNTHSKGLECKQRGSSYSGSTSTTHRRFGPRSSSNSLEMGLSWSSEDGDDILTTGTQSRFSNHSEIEFNGSLECGGKTPNRLEINLREPPVGKKHKMHENFPTLSNRLIQCKHASSESEFIINRQNMKFPSLSNHSESESEVNESLDSLSKTLHVKKAGKPAKRLNGTEFNEPHNHLDKAPPYIRKACKPNTGPSDLEKDQLGLYETGNKTDTMPGMLPSLPNRFKIDHKEPSVGKTHKTNKIHVLPSMSNKLNMHDTNGSTGIVNKQVIKLPSLSNRSESDFNESPVRNVGNSTIYDGTIEEFPGRSKFNVGEYSDSKRQTRRIAGKRAGQSDSFEKEVSHSSENNLSAIRMSKWPISPSNGLDNEKSQSSDRMSRPLTDRMAQKPSKQSKRLKRRHSWSAEAGMKKTCRKADKFRGTSICSERGLNGYSGNGTKKQSTGETGRPSRFPISSERKLSGSKMLIDPFNDSWTEINESSGSFSQSDHRSTVSSSNQNTLDDFTDTAAEYYKDFNVEEFRRKKSLRDNLQNSTDMLLPLIIKKGHHSNRANDDTTPVTRNKRYIMYRPKISCISPILYKGDDRGSHLEKSDEEQEAVKDEHDKMSYKQIGNTEPGKVRITKSSNRDRPSKQDFHPHQRHRHSKDRHESDPYPDLEDSIVNSENPNEKHKQKMNIGDEPDNTKADDDMSENFKHHKDENIDCRSICDENSDREVRYRQQRDNGQTNEDNGMEDNCSNLRHEGMQENGTFDETYDGITKDTMKDSDEEYFYKNFIVENLRRDANFYQNPKSHEHFNYKYTNNEKESDILVSDDSNELCRKSNHLSRNGAFGDQIFSSDRETNAVGQQSSISSRHPQMNMGNSKNLSRNDIFGTQMYSSDKEISGVKPYCPKSQRYHQMHNQTTDNTNYRQQLSSKTGIHYSTSNTPHIMENCSPDKKCRDQASEYGDDDEEKEMRSSKLQSNDSKQKPSVHYKDEVDVFEEHINKSYEILGDELNIQPTFDQTQKNLGRVGRIVDRERTPPSFISENDDQRFLQDGYIGSKFRNRRNSVQNASRWFRKPSVHKGSTIVLEKKVSTGLAESSKTSGSLPLTPETSDNIPINRNSDNRSKSFIRQYQKVHDRLHCRRADSLPVEGMNELEHNPNLAMRRSKSLGKNEHRWPSVNQVINYSKHTENQYDVRPLRCNSRGSDNTPINGLADSDDWPNNKLTMSLKVPTGGRGSFHNTGQSQFTGSIVETNQLDPAKSSSVNVIDIPHDGFSQSHLILSPPNIPPEIDMEKGSLTSNEPDLELVFDDVIDVENLEIEKSDQNLQIEEDKQSKAEKKRRHKHRRHRRKRHEENSKDRNDTEICGNPVDRSKDRESKSKDNLPRKKDLLDNENQADVDGLAKEYSVNDDYKQKEQPTDATEKRKKHRRRMYKHNEENHSLNDGNTSVCSEDDELGDSDLNEDAMEKKSKHRRKRHKHFSKLNEDKLRLIEDNASIGISGEDEKELDHEQNMKKKRRDRRRQHDHHKIDEESLTTASDSRYTISQTVASRNSEYYTLDEYVNCDKQDHDGKLQDFVERGVKDEIEKGDNSSENVVIRSKKEGHKKKKRKKKKVAGDTLDLKRIDSTNEFITGVGCHKGKKKQKRKKPEENIEEYDVELDKLPSIKSQLAKLFGDQYGKMLKSDKTDEEEDLKEDDEEHIQILESDDTYEISDLDNDLEKDNDAETELPQQIIKPKPINDDWIRRPSSNLKKFRSMSLPLLTDIESLPGMKEEISIEELKKPFRVPIYLPRFSEGKIILKKQFKSNPKRVQGRQRSNSLSVVNLSSSFLEDTGTNKSELEPVREETLTVTPEMGLSEGANTPLQLRVVTPAPEKPLPASPQPPKEPPKKKEIIKKEKKVRPPPEPKPRSPTPITREPTPSPPPVEEEPPVSREISFVREPSIPKLPPIEVPELPEFQEVQTETKTKKKEGKLIEVTPELSEPSKKLPPPPKLGPRIKGRQTKKRKVAEAPVTSQELQQLSDPLDFLAKYCIINPDRLPYYERIFNGAINVQTPRYSRDHAPGDMVHLPPAQLSEHELNMLKDMTVITHAQTPRREGFNVPEQYLEKLNYSIEFIKTKQEALHDHMHRLQGEKMQLMAQMAKQMDRDIARVDYKTKGKKKKKDDEDNGPKKKKKKKASDTDYDTMGAMISTVKKDFHPTKASDITDEVIVSRMDDKMLKKAKKDPIVKQLSAEISRDVEKLKNFGQRVSQIEDEKDLVGLYCMDHYFAEQNSSQPPYAFRRQQSRLYQKLHPDPDVEMNMEEVETALQQINNKLLSEKEFQYIYFILDLPKREKINFRLFSIIAALSEKVTQMDPVIRKLINKVDYNALDVKMDKSKELFELLQDEDHIPVGNAPADTLAVELTAGGLTPEHTSYVLSKFNREGRGFIDFLDFVTYVPLFVDIHKRIIEDPFNDCLDI